ncbi:hypothetical protein ACFQX6_55420 [Streptosporangium lutulentum]
MSGLLICTALGIEARAVRGGLSRGSRDRLPRAVRDDLSHISWNDLSEASRGGLPRASRGGFPRDPGNGLPAGDVTVIRIGMGPGRAASAAFVLPPTGAVAVVGFGGALGGALRPGDVLVASEVRFEGRVLPCPSARLLIGELTRAAWPHAAGRWSPPVTS